MGKLKFIIAFISILCTAFFLWVYARSYLIQQRFDAGKIKEKNYTEEELKLFCDIGFWHRRTVKKWDTDIKIEIKNIDQLEDIYVEEVDSCIAILAPLVYPLKMYRVEKNGNLLVDRSAEDFLSEKEVMGLAIINHGILNFSYYIKRANIFDRKNLNTLLHEFEHALGLSHARFQYSSVILLNIGSGYVFSGQEEFDAYTKKKYKISDLEKKMIRMLYSTEIPSGLKREHFMKEMGVWYE